MIREMRERKNRGNQDCVQIRGRTGERRRERREEQQNLDTSLNAKRRVQRKRKTRREEEMQQATNSRSDEDTLDTASAQAS